MIAAKERALLLEGQLRVAVGLIHSQLHNDKLLSANKCSQEPCASTFNLLRVIEEGRVSAKQRVKREAKIDY